MSSVTAVSDSKRPELTSGPLLLYKSGVDDAAPALFSSEAGMVNAARASIPVGNAELPADKPLCSKT